jgi:hypothetical protein
MTQRVRIYQPPKTAMQSGTAGTGHWVMDYVSDSAQVADPLMGWAGGADTQSQVRLHFDTRDEAIAFAEANGLTYQLEIPHQRRIKPKAYADNFKFSRWENWTH